MAHEFQIPVSDLDAGGKSFSFPVRAAWVRGTLEDHDATATDRDGALEVRASKSGVDVVVRGHLEVQLSATCARCLGPVTFEVKQEISALMVPRSAYKDPEQGEYEFSPSDADTFPYDGDLVALDDLVRDELVLETPMIPLCSEDCAGMSPTREAQPGPQGRATGVDPRLLPLLNIKLTKS